MKSRRPNNSRATHSGGSSGSRKRRRRKKKCKCTAIHGAACCIAVIISIGLAFILWPIFAAPGEARVAARKAEAVEEAAKHRNLENELVGEAHSRHLRSGKTAPPLPLTPTIVATPSAAADAGAALAASLLAEQAHAAGKVHADLSGLMAHMMKALHPYLHSYGAEDQYGATAAKGCAKTWEGPQAGFTGGCATVDGASCPKYSTLAEAQAVCVKETSGCSSIVSRTPGIFELRTGNVRSPSSSGEKSWVLRDPCFKTPTALGVWETFQTAVTEARANPALHLTDNEGSDLEPVRTDDSIFLSVASYRDSSCPKTMRTAYEGASDPLKLNVGVIQQNCNKDCKRGTGWGATRKIIPQLEPDVDCFEAFCKSALGKPHCDSGRARILRLNESESFGPFFARYLAAKLWRGETYFMQVDAHSNFRQGWDRTMVAMIKKTPSFPHSIISNYPPGHRQPFQSPGSYTPSALCGLSFEDAGKDAWTVRLQQSGRSIRNKDDVPRRSCFIAAGFFFTHASFMGRVPFDPLLPYLFMGEEIALSVRFWTAGFDIYAPTVDVCGHEYVRKESTKFWETVNMVFDGDMHNALTAIVVRRVHRLLMPEISDRITPKSLLKLNDVYGLGKERPLSGFLEHMGMDLKAQKQIVPAWCRSGDNVASLWAPK